MVVFGLGPTELVIILVIVLIIFGPSKLPQMGRSLGRSIREFRSAAQELTRATDELDEEEKTEGKAKASDKKEEDSA